MWIFGLKDQSCHRTVNDSTEYVNITPGGRCHRTLNQVTRSQWMGNRAAGSVIMSQN